MSRKTRLPRLPIRDPSAHFPKFVLHRRTRLSRTSESHGH